MRRKILIERTPPVEVFGGAAHANSSGFTSLLLAEHAELRTNDRDGDRWPPAVC